MASVSDEERDDGVLDLEDFCCLDRGADAASRQKDEESPAEVFAKTLSRCEGPRRFLGGSPRSPDRAEPAGSLGTLELSCGRSRRRSSSLPTDGSRDCGIDYAERLQLLQALLDAQEGLVQDEQALEHAGLAQRHLGDETDRLRSEMQDAESELQAHRREQQELYRCESMRSQLSARNSRNTGDFGHRHSNRAPRISRKRTQALKEERAAATEAAEAEAAAAEHDEKVEALQEKAEALQHALDHVMQLVDAQEAHQRELSKLHLGTKIGRRTSARRGSLQDGRTSQGTVKSIQAEVAQEKRAQAASAEKSLHLRDELREQLREADNAAWDKRLVYRCDLAEAFTQRETLEVERESIQRVHESLLERLWHEEQDCHGELEEASLHEQDEEEQLQHLLAQLQTLQEQHRELLATVCAAPQTMAASSRFDKEDLGSSQTDTGGSDESLSPSVLHGRLAGVRSSTLSSSVHGSIFSGSDAYATSGESTTASGPKAFGRLMVPAPQRDSACGSRKGSVLSRGGSLLDELEDHCGEDDAYSGCASPLTQGTPFDFHEALENGSHSAEQSPAVPETNGCERPKQPASTTPPMATLQVPAAKTGAAGTGTAAHLQPRRSKYLRTDLRKGSTLTQATYAFAGYKGLQTLAESVPKRSQRASSNGPAAASGKTDPKDNGTALPAGTVATRQPSMLCPGKNPPPHACWYPWEAPTEAQEGGSPASAEQIFQGGVASASLSPLSSTSAASSSGSLSFQPAHRQDREQRRRARASLLAPAAVDCSKALRSSRRDMPATVAEE
eukprot:TRINITY_DN91748_c0_g1_i1.p1 TRINITY_DN91748_c0_g1~~TRINITY_DN91748_c0_g1_i1.p1  ORF type:complete len:789 (-),score=151.06 TRINITY_DN91748_c0_g1_i1:164-2530(-)